MSDEHRDERDDRRPEDSPAAWFVMLEHARRSNDFDAAARAVRELRRLGVEVRYTPSAERGRKAVSGGN
jgi:hypothetical protein